MKWLGPGGLALIVRRSLRHHALSTGITVLSVGLATGLVLSVFAIQAQSRLAFSGGHLGFDAVLGARGSQLQLVLNALFHLETSPGNIPWSMYRAIDEDPRVASAIPLAVGDNYRGYRIVGTTPELFTEAAVPPFELEAGGSWFDASKKEALVGSVVAQRTGLRVGSIFHPYHGLAFDEDAEHADEYEVVGVLRATNSPSDRVVWIPIEGIFRMDGHVLRGSGEAYHPEDGVEIAEEHREVSAVLLKLAAPQVGFMLDQMINKQGTVATLAWPVARIMRQLFDKLGWMSRVLSLVAYLVVVVAAASVLASIYNTMNERRREFAILRALGGRRRTVFAAVVLEAATVGLLGVMVGFVTYQAIFAVARSIVRSQTGVVLDAFAYHPVLWVAPLAIVGLSAVAGVVPALKAYSTDVATNLTPHS